MKIIDLLNKIANGEEVPNKIKYDDMIWEYDGDYYVSKNNLVLEEYTNLTTSLNDKVEILEEEKKIPEKSNIGFNTTLPVSGCSENEAFMMTCISHLGNTIDKIIDYLKSKGK